jgi:hypothetical protein
MKKLYYGAYEYVETTESPKNQEFINECGDYGYLMTYTRDAMPAIYFEGVLYRRGKKYREYESVGKAINKMLSKGE